MYLMDNLMYILTRDERTFFLLTQEPCVSSAALSPPHHCRVFRFSTFYANDGTAFSSSISK